MDKKTQQLNKIINDHSSGSLVILMKIKKHLLQHSDDNNYMSYAVNYLEQKLKHFSAVQNFLKDFKKVINKSDQAHLKKFLEVSILNQEFIFEDLFKRHKNTLLKYQKVSTISFSKTLLEIFKLWHKENNQLEIFIAESRPKFEGRILAKELLQNGIKCNLVVDAMMNYAVQNSDCIIIGADQILKNGNVVNKIGSYPLSLCAKATMKPFYVLATEDKVSNTNKFTNNDYPSQEIWDYKNRNLKIINQYFEIVPKQLITKTLI